LQFLRKCHRRAGGPAAAVSDAARLRKTVASYSNLQNEYFIHHNGATAVITAGRGIYFAASSYTEQAQTQLNAPM
jgi:hypothetical protein